MRLGFPSCGALVRVSALAGCGSSNGSVGVAASGFVVAANCVGVLANDSPISGACAFVRRVLPIAGVVANDSPFSGACTLVRRVLPIAGVAALGGSEKSRLLRGSVVGVALGGLPVVGVALPGCLAMTACSLATRIRVLLAVLAVLALMLAVLAVLAVRVPLG